MGSIYSAGFWGFVTLKNNILIFKLCRNMKMNINMFKDTQGYFVSFPLGVNSKKQPFLKEINCYWGVNETEISTSLQRS